MNASPLSPILSRALLALALYTLAAWALIGSALLMWAPGRSLAASTVSHIARVMGGAASSEAVGPIATMAAFASRSGGPDIVLCADTPDAIAAFSDNTDDAFAWGLLGDGDPIWSGGSHGRATEREARRGAPRLWFREDGEEYVVTDPVLVAQVHDAVEPLRRVGEQMGLIGGEMGRRGARMGHLGGRMGAVSARMGLVQARLAGRPAREHAEARAELEQMRAELEQLRSQMDQLRADSDPGMGALSRQMSELSAQHAELLKEARQKVREIATRARREGKAERPHANA